MTQALWRDGNPFPQRFAGAFADAGSKIIARWEKAVDGSGYEIDFHITYTRVE
jgi:hypothetical protein